ncbi:hypothetical protein ACN28C_14350 [Plantactinospora sp. WMMC1484]|uniref:hypothetical protein n=1 Tax=Plantactinospora sp. WMMC1484 TaxID=3404122 RepID=UPI003BF4B864
MTIALGHPAVAPEDAVTAILDQLTAANGTWFGGAQVTGARTQRQRRQTPARMYGATVLPRLWVPQEAVPQCSAVRRVPV